MLALPRKIALVMWAGVLALVCVASSGQAWAEDAPDPSLGERLYLKGILASGESLQGVIRGDVMVSGTQDIACVRCHRRSGYGASEGGSYVLPVNGASLYEPREANRAKIFNKLFKEDQSKMFWARMRSPHIRPAYTDASLMRVIREGVDPSGRKLVSAMPRYDLPEQDMRNLVAYLKLLRTTPDPGVDDKNIYFATIVTSNADPAKRKALLNTLDRFFEWINLETTGNFHNPNFSPHYRSELLKSARLWKLSVWDLKGAPDTWAAQLAEYYRKKPVFAVIGGLVDGPWEPVSQICEREKVPCLFPHTDLPTMNAESYYSVFFNRGLTLEAEVIAQFLADAKPASRTRILQLHYNDLQGTVPADALSKAMAANAAFQIENVGFGDEQTLHAALAHLAEPYDALVLWPSSSTADILQRLNQSASLPARIFLPSTSIEQLPSGLSTKLRQRLFFAYPYDLPDAYHSDSYRTRAWLASQKVPLVFPEMQLDTFYALNIVQYALDDMIERFSRDYLLESVERLSESATNPGVYPRLSLGPGQRFASRGAYIVQIPPSDVKFKVVPASRWIIP